MLAFAHSRFTLYQDVPLCGGTVNADGGRVSAVIPVTPSETLAIYVGGMGAYGTTSAGGFNGGGGGGGSSFARRIHASQGRMRAA